MAPGVGGYKQINKALNICAFEDYLEGQQANLPKLADVEQISPRVIRILGQNPGKVPIPTYLILFHPSFLLSSLLTAQSSPSKAPTPTSSARGLPASSSTLAKAFPTGRLLFPTFSPPNPFLFPLSS